MKKIVALLAMTVAFPAMALLCLITYRFFMEARYIPSESMSPSYAVGDRIFIEKVTKLLNRKYVRGEVVVFYPPSIEMGGHDLSNDPLVVLGRLTGLPFLPNEPAFIKRVIGLPGDTIKIKSGLGVFVNGKLLKENYTLEPIEYDLDTLGDIGGTNVYRQYIHPFGNDDFMRTKPILVPEGHLFLMGDNRNNTEDSHIYGFVDQDRVIGRVFIKVWPKIETIDPPKY